MWGAVRILAAGSLLDAEGWLAAPAPQDEVLELYVAVKQQRLGELQALHAAISDPTDPQYGQHLTLAQVSALVAPRPQDQAAVEAAFPGHEISWTQGRDFAVVRLPVSAAEALVGGAYQAFTHPDGRRVLRNPAGAVPAALSDSVDFIAPLGHGLPRAKAPQAPIENLGVAPKGLRAAYGVDVEATSGKVKQAATAFLNEHAADGDVAEFFSLFYTPAKGRKVSKFVGDGPTSGNTVEASLDIEYIMAMGSNVTTEQWSFGGHAPGTQNEPFLKFLLTLGNTSDAPHVISSSYGEDEDAVPLDYAQRCDVEFQKAGVRGISLLFASGDSGVKGDGGACSETRCPKGSGCFVPMFPAASPYVTAVGGTGSPGAGEAAASLSSGGFSYRYARPAWQNDAVATFLKASGEPDPSLYNAKGRAFPDVAASAEGYVVVVHRIPMPVSGTSCAAPAFAGMVATLNDLRMAQGKPALGFLNPFLYQNADALRDIASGANGGCDFGDGFKAVKGYDPVTGLGVMDFQKMKQRVTGAGPSVVV